MSVLERILSPMSIDIDKNDLYTMAWIQPPNPRSEARALVALVQRGVDTAEGMRRLIAVSPKDRSKLNEWKRIRPELAVRIENCIRFRAEVLFAFDALLRDQDVRANPGRQDRRRR
jgi:hypothetical protein